jgi:hypothetical protein
MESLVHAVLACSPACGYGVLLVLILLIVARFTLVVIALAKARPQHVTDIIRAAFTHRWLR